MQARIRQFLESRQDDAAKTLCDLIAHRSLTFDEQGIQAFTFDHLAGLGFRPEYNPIDEDIADDPDYTNVIGHKGYAGRNNVTARIPGTGGGRSLLLNAHNDVVPGPDDLFTPRYENGTVYGRGACDDKGCVLTMLLAAMALKELGVRLKGDLEIQIVIEEEVGGNGALSLIRQGHVADAALILESTELHVCPANRGAVWYRLAIDGKRVHMAKWYDGVNAVDEMMGLVSVLRGYEKKLREDSRGTPLFPDDPSPVVVNIGTVKGGDWPATVAGDCEIEGGVAFLPNKRLKQIQEELTQAIEAGAGPWAKDHYKLGFVRLHNDAFSTAVDHPAVQSLCRAADQVRGPEPATGFIASCDARLFYHRGGMPTVVFGPGDITHAHSAEEQIRMADILKAAEAIALFAMDWCGVA